jgi:hypothetical protein
MKKIFLAVLVFALSLSLAGVAMAAAPKPPANICLGWSGLTGVLYIKASGNTTSSVGKVKFYTIVGEITNSGSYSAPATGTGHMKGNVFHIGITGFNKYVDGRVWLYILEGFWDVVNKTGTGSLQGIVRDNATGNAVVEDDQPTLTLVLQDCSTSVIVYSEDSDLGGTGRLPSEGP